MWPARLREVVRLSIASFFADEALSRGAAIAFYSVTSIAPVLVIVVAIAGFFFGHDAATGALTREFTTLMGRDSARLLADALSNASSPAKSAIASIIGIVTLMITASGVFSEMQTALNVIWKVKPQTGTVSRMIRARAVSLGLVAALGFLLMVSLVISTAINAFGDYLDAKVAFGHPLVSGINLLISYALLCVLFAAIYKVLPDRSLAWSDVIHGSMLTAFFFSVGKFLISIYIGSSTVSSTYGAAGALIIILLWVYYSAQLFLLGAEFTKAFASHPKSVQASPEP